MLRNDKQWEEIFAAAGLQISARVPGDDDANDYGFLPEIAYVLVLKTPVNNDEISQWCPAMMQKKAAAMANSHDTMCLGSPL